MRSMNALVTAAALPLLGGAVQCHAQWSDDATVNTLVSGDQEQCAVSHSIACPDGGTWIAWYDAGAGYDIMAQKIDASGTPVFASPIQVLDQSLSYVQDFDLCAAGTGCAVATADGANTEVICIDGDGSIRWYHNFGDGGGYHANAQVCELNDGFIAAGWMDEELSKVHRIAEDGSLMWAAPVELSDSGSLSMSDLQPSSDHNVIASLVAWTTFTGPKRLKAQCIRADGSLVWAVPGVSVFTSGSLQFGNYPEFIVDDAGGSIFTWYNTSDLQSYVQWIDADGTIAMGSSGLQVLSSGNLLHTGPSACFDATTGEATVFCTRLTSNQADRGVQAARVNMAGDLLWGTAGVEITAVGSSGTPHDMHAVQQGALACVGWLDLDVTGSGTAHSAALSSTGASAWERLMGGPDADRSDLSLVSHDDMLVASWLDGRDGSDRAWAQNVNNDGTLGGSAGCEGDFNSDGEVGVEDLLAMLAVWGDADAQVDLNGDGEVGVEDLLALLALWGECG